jgi:transposase
MPEKRRRYDPDFRAGAVGIVRETNKSVAQVARDLGIDPGTLAHRVAKDKIARGEKLEPDNIDPERVRQLEAENAELRMEREPGLLKVQASATAATSFCRVSLASPKQERGLGVVEELVVKPLSLIRNGLLMWHPPPPLRCDYALLGFMACAPRSMSSSIR